MKWHAWSVHLAVATVCLFPELLRFGGGVVYVALIAACSTLLWRGINSKELLQFAPFLTVSAIYISLSFLNVLPVSWTTIFDRAAIAQQASFVVALPVFYFYSKIVWRDIFKDEHGATLFAAVSLLFFLVPTISLIVSGYGLVPSFLGFFRSLSNAGMIGYLALAISVSLMMPFRRAISASFLFPAMVLFTPFLQNQILALLFLGQFLSRHSALILWATIAAFMSAWLMAFGFIEQIRSIAPTLSVRLDYQLDVFSALYDTAGLGVGFGTEAVRPTSFLGYFAYSQGFSIADVNQGWLFISVHNSFVGMFFRLGALGGIAFLYLFISLRPRGSAKNDPVACIAYFASFLCLFSNPGIESPAYLIGIAAALGLCRARQIYL